MQKILMLLSIVALCYIAYDNILQYKPLQGKRKMFFEVKAARIERMNNIDSLKIEAKQMLVNNEQEEFKNSDKSIKTFWIALCLIIFYIYLFIKFEGSDLNSYINNYYFKKSGK